MIKVGAAILMMAIGLSLVAGWMQGGGGVQAVVMTAAISESAIQIPVADTNGFLTSDVITIDGEHILYTAKDATHFNGLTRGYDDTTPADHNSGTYVYTETASALNQSMGFNAASLSVQNGTYAALVAPLMFMTVGLPRSVMAGESLFTGDLAIIQYMYVAICFAYFLSLSIAIGTVVAYVLRR